MSTSFSFLSRGKSSFEELNWFDTKFSMFDLFHNGGDFRLNFRYRNGENSGMTELTVSLFHRRLT